jgi:hypothetical protein
VDDVIHNYNMALLMESLNLLPKDFIKSSYGKSIARAWKVGEPYIDDYRKQTDDQQSLHFETLAQEMIRSGRI